MVKHTIMLKSHGSTMRLAIKFDSAANIEPFFRLYAEAIKAERDMKATATPEACEQYGKAIMALYELVMGEQTARAVETWFGDDVRGMVQQINPVMNGKILQDAQKCSAINRERMKRDFLRQQKKAKKP